VAVALSLSLSYKYCSAEMKMPDAGRKYTSLGDVALFVAAAAAATAAVILLKSLFDLHRFSLLRLLVERTTFGPSNGMGKC
jgi:hypothetical protein